MRLPWKFSTVSCQNRAPPSGPGTARLAARGRQNFPGGQTFPGYAPGNVTVSFPGRLLAAGGQLPAFGEIGRRRRQNRWIWDLFPITYNALNEPNSKAVPWKESTTEQLPIHAPLNRFSRPDWGPQSACPDFRTAKTPQSTKLDSHKLNKILTSATLQ